MPYSYNRPTGGLSLLDCSQSQYPCHRAKACDISELVHPRYQLVTLPSIQEVRHFTSQLLWLLLNCHRNNLIRKFEYVCQIAPGELIHSFLRQYAKTGNFAPVWSS